MLEKPEYIIAPCQIGTFNRVIDIFTHVASDMVSNGYNNPVYISIQILWDTTGFQQIMRENPIIDLTHLHNTLYVQNLQNPISNHNKNRK